MTVNVGTIGHVPDAGTGLMLKQAHGPESHIYKCPKHSGADCSMCGGSGYRIICNRTACHEHGCSFHNCGSTKQAFDIQQRRIERSKQRGMQE